MSYFASGGVVNKPTIGMVGEAGPEAIIPLNGGSVPVEMKGSGSGGVTVINNITVESSGGDAQADQRQAKMIGQAIDLKIKQTLVQQQRPGGLLARRYYANFTKCKS